MISTTDLAGIPLFDALPPAMRTRIAVRSGDLSFAPNEWIVRSGEAACFWTVLDGTIEVVRNLIGHEQRIVTFERGDFFGDIPLMLGAEFTADFRAVTKARLMRTDPADFHLMIATSSEASAIVSTGLLRHVDMRRSAYVTADAVDVLIIGSRLDLECHELRDFLLRNQIPYEWLDPSEETDAPVIPAVALRRKLPVAVFVDGRVLERPSFRELAEGLGLPTVPRHERYDLAIIGGGPAGLAAAVYGSSEGLTTVMLEREAPGGQAGTSSRIENYLGFPYGIPGDTLANRALIQAKRLGAEIVVTRDVDAIASSSDGYAIELDGGVRLEARTVVVATGVRWRQLAVPGASELLGCGVYYGAARTEARGVHGKDVFLIGGGNSSGQAAMFFSQYARSVTLLIRGASIDDGMSAYLVRELKTRENVTVETYTNVERIDGQESVESVTTRKRSEAASRTRRADALFVFIGAEPETHWMPHALERDNLGYIHTGRDIERWTLMRPPYTLETSMPGIFAVGDVRSGSIKRVASGVGEGSMAVSFVHQFLALTTEVAH